MLTFRELKKILHSSRKVVITTHLKPDADALGSSLALKAYLNKLGNHVVVITPTDYPGFLFWMEGNGEVVVYHEEKREDIRNIIREADIIFCLDFNNLNRIGKLEGPVRDHKGFKILIDHHLEPEKFYDYAFASVEAAATAELIYEFIVKMGDRHLIDKNISECLYAGIMTDTGQFKHNNVTRNVHFVTANLMELGADTAKVGSLIYDNNSYDRMKFLGFALSERLTYLPEYKTAYMAISLKDLQRFNSQTGDTEGLVNYALSLNEAVLAALITEREDGVRLSFRSKGNFSVNDLARAHFKGGGHKNAAGGDSFVSLEETVKQFVGILPLYHDVLNKTYLEYAALQ